MFTGIVRDAGEVLRVEPSGGLRRIRIKTALDLSGSAIGASIACDGCCLTVVEKGPDWFEVEAAAETLARTTAGGWVEGSIVNLEPSLRLGDEMGGHIVSGHVDGLATVGSITPDGDSWRFKISVPGELSPFIAPKGSVTLNGISLTVNEVEGDVFGICIIPHTWKVTNISRLRQGDRMNLEIDMLARYVARLLEREAA